MCARSICSMRLGVVKRVFVRALRKEYLCARCEKSICARVARRVFVCALRKRVCARVATRAVACEISSEMGLRWRTVFRKDNNKFVCARLERVLRETVRAYERCHHKHWHHAHIADLVTLALVSCQQRK